MIPFYVIPIAVLAIGIALAYVFESLDSLLAHIVAWHILLGAALLAVGLFIGHAIA